MRLPDLESNIPGSKYFRWKEALELGSLPGFACPTHQQFHNIIKQAKALDKIREHFGKPIIVTSWLRPTMYNKVIGGATRSAHLEGLATDFIIKGLSCDYVKKEIQDKGLYPGRGELNTTNWVHLDLREGDWFNG